MAPFTSWARSNPHILVGWAAVVLTGAFTLGVTFTTVRAENNTQDQRIEELNKKVVEQRVDVQAQLTKITDQLDSVSEGLEKADARSKRQEWNAYVTCRLLREKVPGIQLDCREPGE